ncbi:hypothetical protein F8M41_000948 [Gigaspora margarita]|uniref:Putative amidase domain-containing protein n=1 Tax=Gigaspora margarita TaxID=4874 RepID=A0A8H4A859_GIGMA|nr:hypothetical protein F8M41_000948 [Gigaspora margarita]
MFAHRAVSITYDRQKTVDYALTYCSLYSGGIPQSNEWFLRKSTGTCQTTSSSRCYDNYEYTTKWSVVNDFYDYLINKNIAKACDLKDLQPGDFVQYGKKPNFLIFTLYIDWHHTTIVIEKSTTNPKLVSHSTDRCNTNHNYIMTAKYTNGEIEFDDYRCLCINSSPPSLPIKLLSVPGNEKC